MKLKHLSVKVKEFSLPMNTVMDTSVMIPAVKGVWWLKYGEHAYYFMNFRTSKGICLKISHHTIMKPGMARLKKAAAKQGKTVSLLRSFSSRFHYGFNLLEQVMLMTVPHTVTPVGNNRFIVNLWSWSGYLLIDTDNKSATYHLIDEKDDDSVLGSQQWHDSETGELYAMSYSLSDSLARIDDTTKPVSSKIFKHRLDSDANEIVWSGELADYMHDIIINKSRQYCVACELGMYIDDKKDIIPSKVIIIDLKNNKKWVLDRFVVAAHACFDPDNPNIVYFSNHNFEFQHSNLLQLLKKGSYSVKFRGPASIYKYEITEDGPREIGMFTHEDFYRLTNMHLFNHKGKRMISAMGFPDEVFIIDADDMTFIRKIIVKDPVSIKNFYSKKPALIGTIVPSPDGEKLFVQTTKSFQIINIATGNSEYARSHFFSHICFNHMVAVSDSECNKIEDTNR